MAKEEQAEKQSKVSTKTGLKWKKKKWFEIVAPPMFQGKVVGESFAETSKELIGRTVVTNMMAMQGNIKKQNLEVTLQVQEVVNDKAITYIKDFHLQKSSIRKQVRKKMSKVDESFVCATKDGKHVRVKIMMGTRSLSKGGVLAALRRVAEQWAANRVAEQQYEEIVRDLIEMKFQKDIKVVLDKIYPLKFCQVRYFGFYNNPRVKIVLPGPLPVVSVDAESGEQKSMSKKSPRKKKTATEQAPSGVDQAVESIEESTTESQNEKSASAEE